MIEDDGARGVPGGEPESVSKVRKGFERRRLLMALAVLALPVLVCGWVIRNAVEKPTEPVIGSGLSVPTVDVKSVIKVVTGTVTAVSPQVAVAIPQPSYCRVVNDIVVDGRLIPAYSLVVVSGFSFARGGMYVVGGSYVSGSDIRCDNPVPELPIRLPVPTSTSASVIKPSLGSMGINATPVRTATIVPSPTVPLNGIDWDGDCVTLHIRNVRSVYVDGVGQDGGSYRRLCGVSEIKINFR